LLGLAAGLLRGLLLATALLRGLLGAALRLALLAADRALRARDVARRVEEVEVPFRTRKIARSDLFSLAGSRGAACALHRGLPNIRPTQEVKEDRLALDTNLCNFLSHPYPPSGRCLSATVIDREKACQMFFRRETEIPRRERQRKTGSSDSGTRGAPSKPPSCASTEKPL